MTRIRRTRHDRDDPGRHADARHRASQHRGGGRHAPDRRSPPRQRRAVPAPERPGTGVGGQRADEGAGPRIRPREVVESVNSQSGFVTLVNGPSKKYRTDGAAPTVTAVRLLVIAAAAVTASAVVANPQGNLVTRLTVDQPENFVPGDTVTADANANTGVVDRIVGTDLWLTAQFAGAVGAEVRLANVKAGSTTFRLDRTDGSPPVARLEIRSGANTSTVAIASLTPSGLVTLTPTSTIASTHPLSGAAGTEPIVTPQELRLVVTPPSTSAATGTALRRSLTEPGAPALRPQLGRHRVGVGDGRPARRPADHRDAAGCAGPVRGDRRADRRRGRPTAGAHRRGLPGRARRVARHRRRQLGGDPRRRTSQHATSDPGGGNQPLPRAPGPLRDPRRRSGLTAVRRGRARSSNARR